MYKRIIICSIFLLSLLIPTTTISAQTMEEADGEFGKGSILLSRGDYARALEKLGNAAQIYLSLDAERESMVSLYKTGECLLMLGYYEMAVDTYLLALPLSEKVGSRNEKALIQNQIGVSYFNLQNYEMALSYYNEALRYYTKIEDIEGMALVHGNIGVIFDDTNRLDEAIIQYQEALSLYEQISDYANIADTLYSSGLAYEALGQFQKAADTYSSAAEINAEIGDKSQEAHMVYKLGIMQKNLTHFDDSRTNLLKALTMQLELQNPDVITIILSELGEIENSLGNYRDALGFFEQVYEIDKINADPGNLAKSLYNLGGVYEVLGQYDEALSFYEKSLESLRNTNDPVGIASNLVGIGNLYCLWGRYDQSLEFFEESLALYKQLNDKEGTGVVLGNIGTVFSYKGELEKSYQYSEKALAEWEDLGDPRAIALLHNNLGQLSNLMGDYDQAIIHFEHSLELSEKSSFKYVTASVFNNLGSVYSQGEKDHEMGIEYFMKALDLFEELERQSDIAQVLNNIGAGFGILERYDEAIVFLDRAIELKETLRTTAEGAIRRDYLASQLYTYQLLCSSYIGNGNPAKAFETAELSSAKYLIDQLSAGLDESILSIDPVKTYLDKINEDSIVISFTNIDDDEGIARFNADKNRIDAQELSLESFLDTINDKHGSRISEDLFYLDLKGQPNESGMVSFEDIINYYRYLLTAYSLGSDELVILHDIETSLYEFLFSGLEERLTGKDEILIIPGGILAFVPFEALRMPDGRYLVERFNIRYTQSLSVLNSLDSREYNTSQKDPLLAFGGAIYDQQNYEKAVVESEAQLKAVIQSTLRDLDRGLNVEETYQMLGAGSWDNLPGTIAEVRALERIVPGSTIFTGEMVNEEYIKSLSTRGVLKDYRVLHFATHGLVVAEFPELSAIVLSLTDNSDSKEDGYLRMGEIAGLEIEADFVNLSACETGLGKIYGGEGVVGLTQSFLVAGANGLSVSLWQVSDESTMEFMTGVYKLVTEQGIDYNLAMMEMKRRFIAGGQYSEPFYWAPFVYYGK